MGLSGDQRHPYFMPFFVFSFAIRHLPFAIFCLYLWTIDCGLWTMDFFFACPKGKIMRLEKNIFCLYFPLSRLTDWRTGKIPIFFNPHFFYLLTNKTNLNQFNCLLTVFYVPICHEFKYFFCLAVRTSIFIPVEFNFNRAILTSICFGTG